MRDEPSYRDRDPVVTSAEITPMERFFVQAASINQVRRALDRAPGGAQVIGRFDRRVIECGHTMSSQSLARHWPVLLSRFEKAGIAVVDRPATQNEGDQPDDRPGAAAGRPGTAPWGLPSTS